MLVGWALPERAVLGMPSREMKNDAHRTGATYQQPESAQHVVWKRPPIGSVCASLL
jgi:hypothetical protein